MTGTLIYKWFCIAMVFIFFSFMPGMVGCTNKKDSFPQGKDTTLTPTQEVVVSTWQCYEGSHLVWKLEPDRTYKTMGDSSTILAVPVRFTIFDSLGDTATHVLSDSGRTTEEFKHIYIWGDVIIRSQDGLIVKSQSLWWDKTSRKVGSDDFVEIQNPDGNVLRGKGLDASDSFSWWTLRENVSGEFPNFDDWGTANEDTL